jgi:hypothetical protein
MDDHPRKDAPSLSQPAPAPVGAGFPFGLMLRDRYGRCVTRAQRYRNGGVHGVDQDANGPTD